MADVNASINIDINASSALAQLRALESQISNFNNSVARSNAAAVAVQKGMVDSLRAQIDATGNFNTSLRTMEGSLSSVSTAFDKGTLSAREYFRYAASQMPGLANAFRGLGKEQAEMASLAENRVKQLQTRYVSLGRDINGMQKMLAIQPKTLAAGYATDIALAEQRQQLFNRALQLGSTGMVNWGKNTQWAGRQLMVGFTVPMTIAAGAAAKFFMDLEKSGVAFRRVYGDMDTTTQEAQKNLQAIQDLGVEYTKYGLAVNEVIDIGARAAATGAQNEDLLAATEQTIRLATLGQTDYQTALDATISLQTAFGISSANLAKTIDFLNAVENQTVLTLEDVARAVPRVAPVIKGLGGDVQDLAVFMTALREGGVSAEQGANALKSGLASLINPTARATETLKEMGINIKAIVDANRGDLMGTVRAFGQALESVSEFERQQALEATFGKYQYARLGALFKNIARDGSQAARAMELAGMSVEDLATLSEQELSVLSESVTNKFLGAVERLKVAIAPIGEMFLKVMTPIIEVVTTIANKFNELPDTVKIVIAGIVGAVGLIAPAVLMGIGLIANGIGNGLKFILLLRGGIKNLVGALTGSSRSFQYQSAAALDAAAAMNTLDGRSDALTGSLLMQEGAVRSLAAAYGGLAGAASSAAASMPAAFPGVAVAGGRGARVVRRAMGGIIPGTGNTDSVPALLTPGEFVMTKEATEQFRPVLAAMNAGTTQGFQNGGEVTQAGRSRASRLEFAHIADKFEMTTDDISRMMRNLEEMGASSSKAYRELERASRASEKVYGYTNLGVPLRGDINALLGTQGEAKAPKGQVSAAVRQSGAGAAAGIIDVLAQRGVVMDDADAQRFANEFSRSFADEIDNLPDEMLKDRNLTQPFRTAVQNAGTTISKDFSSAAMRIVDEEMQNITAIVTETGQKHGGVGRASVPTGGIRGRVTSYLSRRGARSSIFSRLMGGRTMQQVAQESVPLGTAINQGTEQGMGNASPSRLARGAVDNYVDGAEVGAKENIGRATKAGQSLGSAVNRGFEQELSPSQARGAVILGQQGRPTAPTTQAGAPIMPAASGSAGVSAALVEQEAEINDTTRQTRTMRDRIRGVSGKLFGVSAALTGLSIAGSFMGGQIGETANSIMPFAFALDGITGLLPMMMNPAGAVIAGLAAVGGGLWFLNNQMNNVREEAQGFADALTTSASEVRGVAEFFGNKSLVERQGLINVGASSGLKTKDVVAGMEFIGSEVGQEMAKEFSIALESQGGTQSAAAFANKLASMMMQGAIDFTQAKQMAAGLAQQLGQPEISAQIIGQLQRIVGPDGTDITRRPLQIAAEITANEQQIVEGLATPAMNAINKAMSPDNMDIAKVAFLSPLSGIITQLGIDIPYVTDMAKNMMSFIDDDFEKATASVHAYGKAVGNGLRNAYDNLNSAIIRNDEIIQNAKKKDKPELRQQALREEARLREQIATIQETAEQNFSQLVQKNAALSKEALDGMQVSLKEMYQDPAMQMVLDNLFDRTGGLDQEVRFDILMNLQSGALNPMAANSLFDIIGSDEQSAAVLNLMVEAKGLDKTNEFLVNNMMLGDPEVRRKYIIDFALESGAQGDQFLSMLGFGSEQETALQDSLDQAISQLEWAESRGFSGVELNTYAQAVRDAESALRSFRAERDRVLTDMELRRMDRDPALRADAARYEAQAAAWQSASAAGRTGLTRQDISSGIDAGTRSLEQFNTLAAETMQNYDLVVESIKSKGIEINVDAKNLVKTDKELENITEILKEYDALPEDMQKTINVDTLQGTAAMEVFDINWKNIDSFAALQKEIGVLDSFSSPMQAFGMSWAQFSSLPNIYKEIIVQYTLAVQKVEGEYKGMQAAGFQMSPDSAAGRIQSSAALAAAPVIPEIDVPEVTGGGGTDTGGGGGGGGGGEAAKSGADLVKEMIDGLKQQLKFLGDYKKVGDEVKSGLAQALRNAGAPEQLIADIIAKGADGIKMAKELLKDKAKKLKEVTDLMLEVTRLTFVEQQRADAANLATQASAQMALARSGIRPDVIANLEPQQAQAIADSFAAYQAAQRKADAAQDKSKQKQKEANRELAKSRKEWQMVTGAINQNTQAQEKNAIAQSILGFAQRAVSARRQRRAQGMLLGQGLTFDQASSIAGDEQSATAVIAANKAVQQGETKVNNLLKERSKYPPESKKYKALTKKIEEARSQLRAAKKDQKDLNEEIREMTAEEQALSWMSVQQNVNTEIAKQVNNQKFINMGIKDGLVLNKLNELSLEDQNYFLKLNSEEQQKFLASLAESIPLTEKISDAFERISDAQRLQTLRNEEATNKQMGKTIEQYDDQLDLLNDQLDVQNDLLKVQQDKIDIIQEENDDLNRGLELLSRQEQTINEAFDKRIEALDKVEQANARIAQQQQNQLNLSQALAEGDIYAATQAAQQIKQDNATAAIENTREALETAREEQLKNLVVDVNGQLLTRDQIEKTIEGNNDRIYQIQENQIEPIQKVIESLNDQVEAVNTLKEKWQDYYRFLEDNAVDPITGLKYKDLSRLKEFYDAIFNAQTAAEKDARKALEQAMKETGLTIDSATFFTKFGINPTVPGATTQPGGATTQDVNAGKEAAIAALPEVVKVKEAAEGIKKAIVETPVEINKFTRSMIDNAQPAIDKAKESSHGILTKFRNLGTFLVNELMPNSLTPFKEFIAGDLLAAVNNVFTAFMNINGQITGAIVNAGNLANTLNNLEKEIRINIVVNTTHTSSGSPTPTTPNKPKKFMGGLIKMARGGMIPGGIPRDSVPILASPGEFVVRNTMVDKYGMSMLNDINQGSFQPRFRAPSGTSYTKINKPTEINTDRTMYNNSYNINVTANTNANADEIASATVMKIRQMNSMQIRGARG